MLKYLIPIFIIGLVLVWLGFYGVGILSIPTGSGLVLMLKMLGIVVLLLVMGMAVRVLLERLKEIKEEDEDDYRQY